MVIDRAINQDPQKNEKELKKQEARQKCRASVFRQSGECLTS